MNKMLNCLKFFLSVKWKFLFNKIIWMCCIRISVGVIEIWIVLLVYFNKEDK